MYINGVQDFGYLVFVVAASSIPQWLDITRDGGKI